MKNKPIVVYWAPANDAIDGKWTYLYNKPGTVFADLLKYKTKNNENKVFECPAFSDKYKKMLTFKMPMDSTYEYDFSDGKTFLEGKGDHYINLSRKRDDMFVYGPNFMLSFGILLFAEESLTVGWLPPYFHKPQYTKTCTLVPGQFDVGQWFRPLSFEIQTWENKGVLEFKQDEPLMYIDFQTDRKIELRRFVVSERLDKYMNSSIDSTKLFGRGQTLYSRYMMFRNTGMRDNVLTEIKKNLIEEEPFIF